MESVRQTAGRLEKDVEELEALASLTERFDHAGRFEKRGISMNSLLDAMDSEDELSRSLRESEERLDGLRWQLRTSPKSSGREVRMTTKALKRDLAALEEDMSPRALASEAREAARASNARRGNGSQRDFGQSR